MNTPNNHFRQLSDRPQENLTDWLHGLEGLSWSLSVANESADEAIHEAQRKGIPTNFAIRQVFEVALERFLQCNPALPFQACSTA